MYVCMYTHTHTHTNAHHSQQGGGMVTLSEGEYMEEETLLVGSQITIRARPGAKVTVKGPRGKSVIACDDPKARCADICMSLYELNETLLRHDFG